MVTGKGPHSTAISLRQFGLTDVFEIIETGAPGGPRKPEGIRAVLDAWPELQPNEVVYMGIRPAIVVAAAWAETADPDQLKAMQPDAIFYSIEAFAPWIL